MNANCVLCLAHAAVWRDPQRVDADEIDIPEGEKDTVGGVTVQRHGIPIL